MVRRSRSTTQRGALMGFKERLKEKRFAAGLTQTEFVERVSVTTRTI